MVENFGKGTPYFTENCGSIECGMQSVLNRDTYVLFILLQYKRMIILCNFVDSLPNVHLRDGDGSYRGRLEIRHTGEWGTVCNKNFNNAAASVVCHQLGYTGAYRVQSFRSGPAGGVIWLENVQCNGNEASLLVHKYCTQFAAKLLS